MQEVLEINGIKINVTLKDIKNTHLSVHPPDGRVTVSAPLDMDLEKLRFYLISKITWIKKKIKNITSQPRENEKLYITQESHYFFGKRYLLKIVWSDEKSVKLSHSKIILHCPENSTVEEKEKIFYDFYRKELKTEISRILEKYKKEIGLFPTSVGIQKMKTKWGSYNEKSGRMLFNIELAKKSKELIEYVVVHEYAHQFEPTHGKIFISAMNKLLPNWELRRKELNELPLKIF